MTVLTADGVAEAVGAPVAYGLRARQPQAIRQALDVLEDVARRGVGVTGTQIARDLGLAKATVYQVLALLVERGYLERVPEQGGFALGPKVAWLGSRAVCESTAA